MLNTTRSHSGGYAALGLGIPLFAWGVFGLIRALRRGANPSRHPIIRALSRFGPPDAVARQLDAELLAPHHQLNGLRLTPNWLVQASGSRLAATRYEDVVWGYKKVTRQRVNGVAVSKIYAAQIWDRHGVCIAVVDREELVNQVLEAICQRAPWLLPGFSPELEQSWKSNRTAMIAAVDQRRLQVAAQMPSMAAQS